MNLLPAWQGHHSQGKTDEVLPATFRMPRAPGYYAGRTTFVNDAQVLTEFARQRPLVWAGIDTAFGYDRPGVAIDSKHTVYDPRRIRPLLLAVSFAEPDNKGGGTLYNFVVDLRRPELLGAVESVLRLSIPFVGHFLHEDLLCILRLGLSEPRQLWDTWIHEKALNLGRNHPRYLLKPGADEAENARAKEEVEEAERFDLSLGALCLRYVVGYPCAGDQGRLEQSFLDHPVGAPFSEAQIHYVSANATAAARLYPLQVARETEGGLLKHLVTVEMPWVVTNARMVWNGVLVDPEKCRVASEACRRHLGRLEPQLEGLGLPNVRSHSQLKEFFARIGLLHLFRRDGKISFDKRPLTEFRHKHPAIPLIRAARCVSTCRRKRF
jgi:DNA polymerase-1